MEKIKKHIKVLFAFALGLSIGFPVGVVCIVFGATNGVVPLLVVGIILAVAGFYVMPILWIKFGEKIAYKNLLHMVVEQNICTVQDLASQTGYAENKVRNMLNYLFLANYLVGYLFHGDTIELNTNKKQSSKTPHTKKCADCGGKMSFDGVKFVCDYCGNTAKKD